MKKKNNPLHSEDLERALQRRAQEDLERKAMEKARNEYNYEQYMKKRKRAETEAYYKLKYQKECKKPLIFLIVIILICLFVYLYQQDVHISDLIFNLIYPLTK